MSEHQKRQPIRTCTECWETGDWFAFNLLYAKAAAVLLIVLGPMLLGVLGAVLAVAGLPVLFVPQRPRCPICGSRSTVPTISARGQHIRQLRQGETARPHAHAA